MRKFILSFTLLCLILTACSAKEFEPNVKQTTEVLELDQEVDPLTLLVDVDEANLTFEVLESNLDVKTPGDYKITYKISSGKKSTEKTFDFVVKDNDAPTIEMDDTINILYGDSFILKDYAVATDERDGDVSDSLHFTGSINTYSVGSYNITVIANDRFGNEATKEVTVNVNEDEKNTYKETICGTYTDTSYSSGQAPTLTLKNDGTFELYLNSCTVMNLVEGQYMQYEDVLYLVSDDHRFFSPNEADLVRFVVQIDGTLMFDSQLELCAPNYGDIFAKGVTTVTESDQQEAQ